MTLTLDPDTRVHLDRIRDGVAREFNHIPLDEVNTRFDQIVTELLIDATFPNFVPVLAWRYSREVLKTIEGLPAEYRT
jgi:hypothetical protein